MTDNNSRLVYTTDIQDPNHKNNQLFECSEPTETEKHISEDLKEKQLMVPKRNNDKTKISRKNPMEVLRREQELKTFAKLIFEQKVTFSEFKNIYFPDKTINQINDTLQTLRHASKHRIKALHGKWQFMPLTEDDKKITADEFLKQIIENKSARWEAKNKKRKNTNSAPSIRETKRVVTIKQDEPFQENPVNVTKTEKETCISIKTNNIDISIIIR